MTWYDTNAEGLETVIFSAVSIRRNLEDYPFSHRLDRASCDEIFEKVRSALKDYEFESFDLSLLSVHERGELYEKGYLAKESKYLIFAEKKGVFISLLSSDHIEIRTFSSGLTHSLALERALEIDRILDSRLNYAFDGRLGYITALPENLGCAITLFAKLFLPALEESISSSEIRSAVSDSNLGVYSRSGYFYDIYTRGSLGYTEKELCEKISSFARRISFSEIEKRESLYRSELTFVTDRIMRSLGTVRYARLISESEAIRLYTDLRLGIYLEADGYKCDYKLLDKIMAGALPNALAISSAKEKDRDAARAQYLSKALAV